MKDKSEKKSLTIELEKAPVDGYVPSDEEYEILKKFGLNKSFEDSIEADRALVYNPQHFPGLYLSSEDHDRIYKNIVGDVLDKIPTPEENSKQVQTNSKLTELSEELKKAKEALVQLCETNPEQAKQLAIEVLIKTGVIDSSNNIEKAQILVKKKQK